MTISRGQLQPSQTTGPTEEEEEKWSVEEERNEEDEDVGTERLVHEEEEEDVGTDKLVHEEEEELEEDCKEDGEDGEDVGTDKLVHEEEDDEDEELEEEDGKEDEEDGCTDKLVDGDEEQEGEGEEEDTEEDLELHDDDEDDVVTDSPQLDEVRMLEDELELAVAVKVRLTIGVLFRGSWISTALLVTSLESESNVRSRSSLIISDPNVQMLNILVNETQGE